VFLLVLCFLGVTQPAQAATGQLGFGGLTGWLSGMFRSHPNAVVPMQHSGHAGRGGQVPAAATRAGKGAGSRPKPGRGQLPMYQPYQPKRTPGRADAHGRGGVFNAKTSTFMPGKSSATVSWYRNADGSVTRRVYEYPANYQAAKGVWEPIDTTLVAGGGRLREKANSVGISLAGSSGGADLAQLQAGPGESVGWSVTGGRRVTARVAGSAATYAGILPGVTLAEQAGPAGVKESIVLASAAAGNVLSFPLDVQGLTPSLAPGGQVIFRNAAGKQVAEIPLGFATDAAFSARSGVRGVEAVSYGLTQSASGWLLTVTVDKSWLDSKSRKFPVTIDPTIDDSTAGLDDTTFAFEEAAGDYSSYEYMDGGTCPGSECTSQADAVSDISFAGSSVPIDGQGYDVTSASLNMLDIYEGTPTAADCTDGTNPAEIDVSAITQDWTVPGSKTYPGPSYGPVIGSASPVTPDACANSSLYLDVGDWVSIPLDASAINDWTFGTQPDYGLAVYGPTGTMSWRIYASDNDPGYEPYLQITYADQAPQINNQWPPNGYSASTLTPELLAGASVPAGSTATQALQYEFFVYDQNGNQVADSGLQNMGDWSVPAGDMDWGQTYYWTVEAYDGQVYSSEPAWQSISLVPPSPEVSTTLSQDTSGNGYDAATGNYTNEQTDASVATVGPSLDVTRDYNSLNWRNTGAFGSGWSSVFDSRAAEQYDATGNVTSVTVTYPDGSQVGFGKNADGTFTPTTGRFATLAAVSGGGYTLIDKNDTVYTYTHLISTGVYGITSIADAVGRTVAFTYSGNEITTMTSSASGRALHLTWATPSGAAEAHVATVSTDPVTAGDPSTALTWTYSYSGDELTAVCPPTSSTACTKYAYSSGSQYQDQAMDQDPQSMWPLDDSQGNQADSAVMQNEGTDDGTYSNVTLGAAGPLAGSSQTAASFNGSDSYVTLPSALVSGASYQTLSLWFKTTGTNEVLFSYSQDPITNSSTPGFYTPSIYIGSDGRLAAEYWYSAGTSPIMTSSAVNDGNWHQVVLTAAGDTQTLYLDGTEVGTLSGQLNIDNGGVSTTSQLNDYVGGGFLGGAWPDETKTDGTTNTGYQAPFSGTIADVEFYTRPLQQSDEDEQYQAGTTPAALLTSITRPSGKTYATISYDPVTGRVHSVTDADGGTWTLSAPVVSGSSQVYDAAVRGSHPSGYFPMDDAAGATDAYDEGDDGPATYNGGVTLGGSGSSPFGDSTGATFDGSTGYMQLPGTEQVTTGPNTVEVWFKMAAGDVNGGVLAEEEQCSLANNPTSCGGYDPVLYVGTDGRLHGQFWINNIGATLSSQAVVNDGQWHYAVLSASSTSQSLYLDGALVATQAGTLAATGTGYFYVGAGGSGGSWPFAPSNPLGYFQGSISDFAFYHAQLSTWDIAQHYAAYESGASGMAPVETVKVNDPGGYTESYTYDPAHEFRELSATDGLGNTTKYQYDTGGFLSAVTDPDGHTTDMGYDVRGNMVSQSDCQNQAAGNCSTSYYTYFPDDTSAQLTANPQNDVLMTARDPGSASASDNTYMTSYTYDKWGDQTSQTTPPVPGSPNGGTTSTVYTDGTSAFPAANGGNAPPGLIASVTDPSGAVTSYTYYSDGDVATITTPLGEKTTYTYDNIGRVLTETETSNTFLAGLTTTYAYNGVGEVTQETDPAVTNRVTGAVRQAQTTTTYDPDGDVLSQTVADISPTGGDASRTESFTYNQFDEVATSTDGDNGQTSYTYDGFGNKTSETDPDGITTAYTYDPNGNQLTTTLENYTGSPAGSQSATNLVTDSRTYDPAGRLASETDAMGYTTNFTYTDNGLPVTETRTSTVPGNSGTYVLQDNTYNAAGQLTQQVTNNGTLTTDYTPDAAGQVTSQTVDPSGVDRTTSFTYDPMDRVLTSTVSSAAGSNSTADTYDLQGDVTSTSTYGASSGRPVAVWPLNAEGGTVAEDTTGNGNTGTAANVTWSGGAAGFSTANTSQITTSAPVLNTAGSFTVAGWANLSATGNFGTIFAQGGDTLTNGGIWLGYDATAGSWSLKASDAPTATTWYSASSAANSVTIGAWTYVVGTFDASTNTLSLYVNGSLAGTATWPSPFNQSVPASIGESQGADHFYGQLSNIQAYSRALSPAEIASLYAAGRTSTAVAGSGVTTTTAYDQRGLPVSSTDPDGNTTTYAYDQAGQLTQTVQPAVSATVYSVSAGAPVTTTANPTTTIGYDTFGDKTETEDADGNVTTYGYDADGQETSQTDPQYTPPGSSTPITPVTSYAYDGDGQLIKQTDPMDRVTTYAYDQLGDQTSVTTPDQNTTTSSYDADGDVLSQTDPTGAVTTATYDYMQRQLTSTQVERYPATQSLTTTMTYDTAGNLHSQTSPAGVTETYGYDAAGDQTSVTDGADNTTSYAYDELGQQVKVTNADGTYTTNSYDPEGNLTSTADFNAAGTQLRSTSATYNGDGDMTSATDAMGVTRTFAYDATNVLTSQTQPVTSSSAVSVSYAYDLAGNQTAYTDGNGNTTYATYNTLGLPESVIEPPAGANTSPADSTSTIAYDADSEPVTETLPGGVQVTSTYDVMGNLKTQSGSGATAATANRSFSYDADGRVTSAATSAVGTQGSPGYQPATSESFTYNDRGEVLTASGSAGSSSFSYNPDGQMASRTDTSGTTSYTYDNAGRLATQADAASGTTATYSYNDMNQVSSISYGSGNDTQSFGYDSMHRLTSDTVKTSAGATVASIGYGYNLNDDVTSMTTTGLATAGGGTGTVTSTYGYDEANRLTSWDNGTSTATYGYDNDGNLTNDNGVTYTYDARDELTSDGTNSYTYSPDGDLASQTTPNSTVAFTSDAYQQQITAGGQSYGYDALDRLLSVTGDVSDTLTYSGMTDEVASDGSATYSRDPSGTITGVDTAASGKTIALSDQHSDLLGLLAPSGTAVSGSVAFDPWGKVTGTTGTQVQVGYQGQWTDPATGQTLMGARFYNPAVGQFLNQDQVDTSAQSDPAAGGDLHAYVDDNPLTLTDPSGNCLVVCLSSVVHVITHPGTVIKKVGGALLNEANKVCSACVQAVKKVLAKPVAETTEIIKGAKHLVSVAGDIVKDGLSGAKNFVVSKAKAAVRTGERAYDATTRVVTTAYDKTASGLKKLGSEGLHTIESTAKATASFVKKHAATIASVAAGVVVFAGCSALTGGAGAIACGALAGVVSSAITQGAKCVDGQQGACSVSSFAEAAVIGGITGAVGGAFGGGEIGDVADSAISDAVDSGAANAVDSGAEDAAASGAEDATATSAEDAAAGTSAESSGADNAVSDAAETGGEQPSEAADAGEGEPQAPEESPSCGGESFTAATAVLLASGKTAAISTLHKGQKVLAGNTKTGKTEARTIQAVLVHHDTDLYDLTVKSSGHAEVIHTTSSHLFWVPGSHGGRWVKAAALRHGTHLRTPGGQEAFADGGRVPAQHDGWMWDLTIQDDHDFYVLPGGDGNGAYYVEETGVTAVLVHNCGGAADEGATSSPESSRLSDIADRVQAALGDDEIALEKRTVAIMQTSDGNLVAANAGAAFTRAQIRVLAANGIGHIPFEEGVHAEVQLLNLAAESSETFFPFTPEAIGASRAICPEICRLAIENSDFPGLIGRVLDDGRNAVFEAGS
jgi:large repetitive protein